MNSEEISFWSFLFAGHLRGNCILCIVTGSRWASHQCWPCIWFFFNTHQFQVFGKFRTNICWFGVFEPSESKKLQSSKTKYVVLLYIVKCLFLARVFPMHCAMQSMIQGVPHITSQTEWEKVFNFRGLLFLSQTWHTTHHKCEKETTNMQVTADVMEKWTSFQWSQVMQIPEFLISWSSCSTVNTTGNNRLQQQPNPNSKKNLNICMLRMTWNHIIGILWEEKL